MKARMVKNEDGLWLLYSNGLMTVAQKTEILQFMFHFEAVDVYASMQLKDVNSKTWNADCFDISLFPGETMAYVTDAFHLVIIDFSPFKVIFEISNPTLNDLLTVPEYANFNNKSVEQVKVFCRNGRIPGAKKIGRDWVIPRDAPYPVDNRTCVNRKRSRCK